MPEFTTSIAPPRAPLFSTRKIVHMSMLIFAFLLPYLTWTQAAGCGLLALLFNVVVLPRLGVDLRKSPAGAPGPDVWTGIVIYPISVLALILLYRHDLHIVGATWAIMALGDGMASVAGGALRGPALPWNREKTWSGFLGFIVAGTAGAYLLTRWCDVLGPRRRARYRPENLRGHGAGGRDRRVRPDSPGRQRLGSAGGGRLHVLPVPRRAQRAGQQPALPRPAHRAGRGHQFGAGGVALGLKMVNRSGAVCGFLLGVAVYLGWGYKSFLVMFAFFLIGSVATRFGYARKAARGVAERRGGARSWREALANSLAGAFFSLLVITTHHEGAFLMASIAAFAEATGDTLSSEIGQCISNRAYLITTLQAGACR